jgi:hypothetical protein
MLTRLVRFVALAAMALAVPVAAHHVDDVSTPRMPGTGAERVSLQGIADEIVVDNLVSGGSRRFPVLAADDGRRFVLVGQDADTFRLGAVVKVIARQEGLALFAESLQSTGSGESRPALPKAAVPATTFTGVLRLGHADNFDGTPSEFFFALETADGQFTRVELATLLGVLTNGMRVTITGRVASTGEIAPDRIAIEALPKTASVVSAAAATMGYIVLPIKFPTNAAAPWTYGADPFTPAALNTAVFGPSVSNNDVKAYYNEVSYGQHLISGITANNGSGGFLLATVAKPDTCDISAIATAARNAATARGYVLSNYPGVLYVFNNVAGCGWSGLAYVGTPIAYSNNTTNLLVIAHELGHNFGLAHAASLDCGATSVIGGTPGGTCTSAEYGDPFDVMGNNRAMHFNSAQKAELSWIAASTVSTHTTGQATYTLTPIESAGGAHYAVKVPASASRTYWIEFRQPIGFDSGLSGFPNNGAQIRVASPFESLCAGCFDDTEFLDMTPATAAYTDGALVAGQTYTDGIYGIGVNVLSATASALTVQVTAPGTGSSTITQTSSPNPATNGSSVTFTATVTGAALTGFVNFTELGGGIAGCSPLPLTGSSPYVVSCTTSSISSGTHNIVAVYTGDSAHATSSSTAISQVVNKAVSSTAIASSLNPSNQGASVTFTATVTGASPTGNVNFTDGGVSIAGCPAVAVTGGGNSPTATCSTASLTVGTHSVQASYGGDAGNAASASATLSQVVNSGGLAATTTTLASSSNPSVAGANVTFTATVTGVSPTGSVNFTNGGVSITGCSAIALAGSGNARTAACTTNALAAGTRSIVAAYSGDANNAVSASSALTQVVKTTSTTALASLLNPSLVGQNVTFTATVTGNAPTGSVNFTDGGTSIAGCAAVALIGSGNSRTAACSTASLTVATHSIVAAYSGDAGNVASASAALSQVVNSGGPTATTTTLASSANPSLSGASVTFTATVTGTAPTGSVNFKDGGVSIAGCSAIALGGSGNVRTAACPTASLTVATHSIVAAYSGDAANAASASATLSQVVNSGGGSQINVALASNGGVASASSVYSAGYPVAAVNNGDRTGLNWGAGGFWMDSTSFAFPDWVQINFSSAKTIDHVIVYTVQDSNTPVDPSNTLTFTRYGVTDFQVQGWNGSAWVALGSVAGNNLVKRTVSFAATTTDRIRVNITGAVSGFSRITEIEAWTSGGGGATPTTTTLASSANPSVSGVSVTFTAMVAGNAPTGSVNFTDGGTSIAGCAAVALIGSGNSRTAACPTASLTVATHSIVAAYSGDAGNVASASAALSQVVNSGGGSQINVALASNGGVASASSVYSANYPAAAINDGDRAGLNYGAGGVWMDNSSFVFPDWVQINFSGAKTIDHVIVYTMQDAFTPVDPSDTLTFTRYGVTDFQVQGWNGSAWVALGSVAGNNLVKRTVSFAATTTDRIRVIFTGAISGFSRITEIEAWGN